MTTSSVRFCRECSDHWCTACALSPERCEVCDGAESTAWQCARCLEWFCRECDEPTKRCADCVLHLCEECRRSTWGTPSPGACPSCATPPHVRRQQYEERIRRDQEQAVTMLCYLSRGDGSKPVEGQTVWMVQYLEGGEYREVDGSRTTDLMSALRHRDRLRGRRDPNEPHWRPSFRVREVDKEPPLPW